MKFSKAIYLFTVLSVGVNGDKNIRSRNSDAEETDNARELQILKNRQNGDGILGNRNGGDGNRGVGNGQLIDRLTNGDRKKVSDLKILGGDGIFGDVETETRTGEKAAMEPTLELDENPTVPHLTDSVTRPATDAIPLINVEVGRFDERDGIIPQILSKGKIGIVERPLSLRFQNWRQNMKAKLVSVDELKPFMDKARMKIEGFAPNFLDINTKPTVVESPKAYTKDNLAPDAIGAPTSVINEDNRIVIQPETYPWVTVGKVVTDWGVCTGTMVGRNVMLTASHCVTEYDDGTIGGLTFKPAYYNEQAPFGIAHGVEVLRNNEVNPENGLTYTEVANDYAVVILDRPIGDTTGWMGIHKYRDIWNDQPIWMNIGYPCDLTGSEKPVYSKNNKITTMKNMNVSPENYVLVTDTDTYVGQSGGPLMGWWKAIDGTYWPHIIGDISAEWVGENYASGGPGLEELILFARNEAEKLLK